MWKRIVKGDKRKVNLSLVVIFIYGTHFLSNYGPTRLKTNWIWLVSDNAPFPCLCLCVCWLDFLSCELTSFFSLVSFVLRCFLFYLAGDVVRDESKSIINALSGRKSPAENSLQSKQLRNFWVWVAYWIPDSAYTLAWTAHVKWHLVLYCQSNLTRSLVSNRQLQLESSEVIWIANYFRLEAFCSKAR